MLTAAPGPRSLDWGRRFRAVAAPMGPQASSGDESGSGPIVYERARGANVIDADGNRYVDLAQGFGSLLLGHNAEALSSALSGQAERLWQSLGDVHPSDTKIRLLERLSALFGQRQAILGQSGADALSAALKTAALYTGKPGVLAFAGAYHGLSYGPLALCGLRESYRAPFAAQLNPSVRFVDYPLAELDTALGLDTSALLACIDSELARGDIGAVVFEPILGRGGCHAPPEGFTRALADACRKHGCLLIADEVWTGLGRAGHLSYCEADGVEPDLLCLGKGLGGGLPLSACLGSPRVMAAWSRPLEVVHTSTYAGAPLPCATALELLDQIERRALIERSRRLGEDFKAELIRSLGPGSGGPVRDVRGAGLMIGLDFGLAAGAARNLQQRLLQQGYIVSLGGGRRESVVLTPPLDVAEPLLGAFVRAVVDCLGAAAC